LAHIRITPAAEADLARLASFLLEADPASALRTYDMITGAIDMLATHPLIGRIVEHGFRELVISRGKSGYLALYDYLQADDLVLILAIRHQREAGYFEPGTPD
jgi:plasmid stabilization system protein ParE